jgi:hypothetical protein
MPDDTKNKDLNADGDQQPPSSPPMAVIDVNDLRDALREKPPEGPTGPNATTNPENPAEHYFLAADGKTKVNAYGEEKGSPEDKRRMAALGYA